MLWRKRYNIANNRLYIGNKKTLNFVFVEKGYGDGWKTGSFQGELIQKFIAEDTFEESNLGPTNLVFFTEQDDELFDLFFKTGTWLVLDEKGELKERSVR